MQAGRPALFAFPDPVNEYAARTVAAGVVGLSLTAIVVGVPWLTIVLAYGFWARVLTGPRLSPLGQLATRVVAPRLPGTPRTTPGAPKRFAQGIGAALTTAAVASWASGNWTLARSLLSALAAAAFLEAAFGLCLGCKTFGLLIRTGLVPEAVCVQCRDLGRRQSEPARPVNAQAGTTG